MMSVKCVLNVLNVCTFVFPMFKTKGADRFPGQDHHGGLPRLAELVSELQASSAEQPQQQEAQALAALSLKSLRSGSGGGAAASGANTGGSQVRPPRPADALKLGATIAAHHDTTTTNAFDGRNSSGAVQESPVWASALAAEVANEPYLRWLAELRRGLGLAYDPQHDQFVRADGPAGAGAAAAHPSSFQFGAPSQDRAPNASSSSSSLKSTDIKKKELATSAGTLLAVAGDSTNFATRKTMASLAKLSALAVAAEANKNDEMTSGGGGVLAMQKTSEEKARKEDAHQMKAAADYELALLQVQQQLHAILPFGETSASSSDHPISWEPPSSIVTRLVEHLESHRGGGGSGGGVDYGEDSAGRGPHPMLRMAMLALVVLDAVASQGFGQVKGAGNSSVNTSNEEHELSEGRGGFYVGTAGGQPVLLELHVELTTQSCSGEGATPGGSFSVGTESKWEASSSQGGAGERVTLQVLPPGGAPPSTLELTLEQTPSPGFACALVNAAAGVHLAQVEKRVAVRAKKLMECKRLAHELWRAVVEYDQGQIDAASSGQEAAEGKWQELQVLADQSSGSEGGSALDHGFSGTLLFAVASAHHAALEKGEFQAAWLQLQWRSSQTPPTVAKTSTAGQEERAKEDMAWLGPSICVEDLGLEATAPGAPTVPLLKKCLDSATRA